MITIAALILAAVAVLGGPTNWISSRLAASFDHPAKNSLTVPAQHTSIAQPVMVGSGSFTPRAKSVYAIDLTSARTLLSHQANERLPVASITKLVTALVILESHRPDEVMTIPPLPAYAPEEARLGLQPGQQFTAGDLVKALLIPSANDAADALAIIDAGNIEAFSAKMNRLAADWGITDTQFTTPNGLRESGNYATAASLTKLASLALRHPLIRQTVATPSGSIKNLAGQEYTFSSTNQLLSDPRVKGLKTGYTLAAGQSLVGLADIEGHEVVTVVLNSPDRFGETAELINWIEGNYDWY